VNEIADASGITERYAYRLLSDLQKAGYVSRRRNGRRNQYQLAPDLELGDPVIGERPLRQLLALIGPDRSQVTQAKMRVRLGGPFPPAA